LRARRSAEAKLFGSESRAFDPAFVFLAAIDAEKHRREPAGLDRARDAR
jgi:hypothetical protein